MSLEGRTEIRLNGQEEEEMGEGVLGAEVKVVWTPCGHRAE